MDTQPSTDLSLLTRPQLAEVFGKDPRTIAKWLDEGMPCAVKGRGGRPSRYSLPAVVQWVIERELQARGGDGEELSPQLERAKLDRLRRQELDLKLSVRRGELVEVAAVQAEYADLAAIVKARLRSIPNAIADLVAGQSPAAVKALLLSKIDEALRELARGAHVAAQDAQDETDEEQPSLAEVAHA